ncbi:hypothetical protein GCM10011509_35020 [Ornithinimicrobium pekingense]|uniref:Uncharacterized protein n=1 Tax=Ornithinimicrobium pekingense TaxID=384677 RepID=A0ABQ2FDP2_9MICO|nr:hypothetical protein GCM10011509_35020 [Ornithinimicrobium pekingense]
MPQVEPFTCLVWIPATGVVDREVQVRVDPWAHTSILPNGRTLRKRLLGFKCTSAVYGEQ